MSHIRLGRKRRIQDFIPVEPIELVCMLFVKRMGEHRFRGIFVVLVIESVFTAEIRNAAFRRNAGTAKEYNIVRIMDHLEKRINSRHEDRSFPNAKNYF